MSSCDFDVWQGGVPVVTIGGDGDFGLWLYGSPVADQGSNIGSGGGQTFLSGSGNGYASGRGTLTATGSLSGSGKAYAKASVTVVGAGLLAGTGQGLSVGSVSLLGLSSIAGLGLGWSTGSGLVRGVPLLRQLSGLGFCLARGSAALIPYGFIRVPEDLLPGDAVHYAGPGCPGDSYRPVLAVSSDKTRVQILFLGVKRWISVRDIRSAVRPTPSGARPATSIIDPPGLRTH